MENSYGIGTTNRFSLLIENDSDPLDTAIKVPEKELKKKATKVAEKENKAKPEAPAKPKPVQPARKSSKETVPKPQDTKREDGKPNQRPNDNKPERTFTKFNNENREERNNRRNREDRSFNGGATFDNNREREERPPKRDAAGGDYENRRGRSVGNKGGRGGPRRPFEDRRGKFDRQSGSDKTHGYRGVKPIDKREGAGAHNWGSHKDVIEEADQTKVTDVDAIWPEIEKTDPVNTTTESKEGEPEAEPTPVEEEPKELTLDEWKAQRAGRMKPTYNLRKAGEGEDQTKWNKMYELSKKKAGEEENTDDEEYDNAEYPQRVGRQKHVQGIDFHFNDSSRRGGGGRGRGTRPGRGRGGGSNRGGEKPIGNRFRSDDPPQGGGGGGGGIQRSGGDDGNVRNAPKMDDERMFPSLG